MIMDLCLSEQYTYQTKIIQTPHPKIPRKKDSTLVDLFWNVMSKYINFVFRFFIIVFCTCIAYLVITKLLILNSARDSVTKLFKFFLGVITQTFRGVITQTVGH